MKNSCTESILVFLVLLSIVACDGASYSRKKDSVEIEKAFKNSNYQFIDFSTLQGDAWTKVCFLGPYNVESTKALGFEWDVTKHTNVLASDGHNVIIFATETDVVNYVVHNRGYGDFWQLTGLCFPREKSKLYKGTESGAWYSD